jgi:hypothetical protein
MASIEQVPFQVVRPIVATGGEVQEMQRLRIEMYLAGVSVRRVEISQRPCGVRGSAPAR